MKGRWPLAGHPIISPLGGVTFCQRRDLLRALAIPSKHPFRVLQPVLGRGLWGEKVGKERAFATTGHWPSQISIRLRGITFLPKQGFRGWRKEFFIPKCLSSADSGTFSKIPRICSTQESKRGIRFGTIRKQARDPFRDRSETRASVFRPLRKLERHPFWDHQKKTRWDLFRGHEANSFEKQEMGRFWETSEGSVSRPFGNKSFRFSTIRKTGAASILGPSKENKMGSVSGPRSKQELPF